MDGQPTPSGSTPPSPPPAAGPSVPHSVIPEVQAMIGNLMLDVAVKVGEKLAQLNANQFSAPVVVMRGDPETGDMKEEKTSIAQLLAEIADDVAYIADTCDDDEDEPSNGRKRGMDKGKKKRGR